LEKGQAPRQCDAPFIVPSMARSPAKSAGVLNDANRAVIVFIQSTANCRGCDE
jgi:hypothetical protein